jgi:CBS-domain-containing membrane protein
MRVEQLMTRDVKVCRAEDTLSRAAQLMWEHDCGCVPVIGTNGDGRLVGIITDRDIAMAAYTQGWPQSAIPVSTAMENKCSSALVAEHAGPLVKGLTATRTCAYFFLKLAGHPSESIAGRQPVLRCDV